MKSLTENSTESGRALTEWLRMSCVGCKWYDSKKRECFVGEKCFRGSINNAEEGDADRYEN